MKPASTPDLPPAPPAAPDTSIDVSPLEATTTPDAPEPWGWTRRHRLGLAVLLGIALVFLVVQFIRRPFSLHDPVVEVDGTVIALETATDPNTADLAALLRIPGMTDKTAEAILAYRESRQVGPGEVVFQRFEDLAAVKVGRSRIAKSTLERLRPFLRFPEDAQHPPSDNPNLTPPRVLGNEDEVEEEK